MLVWRLHPTYSCGSPHAAYSHAWMHRKSREEADVFLPQRGGLKYSDCALSRATTTWEKLSEKCQKMAWQPLNICIHAVLWWWGERGGWWLIASNLSVEMPAYGAEGSWHVIWRNLPAATRLCDSPSPVLTFTFSSYICSSLTKETHVCLHLENRGEKTSSHFPRSHM